MDKNDQLEADIVCQLEEFTKSLTLKIAGYSVIKEIDVSMAIGKFDLGGHSWVINFSPYHNFCRTNNNHYIIFSISLLTKTTTTMTLEVEFSLFNYEDGRYSFSFKSAHPAEKVTKQGDEIQVKYCTRRILKNTPYLKDDCLMLMCSVKLVKPLCVETRRKKVLVPAANFYQSDLYQNSIHLWETGEGADVVFNVSDDIITAHRNVLGARSPVFRAQFFSPMIESKTDCIIKIEDIKPEVFKFVLHFMYTDSLPVQKELSLEMAQHVLVAADRFGVERLKLICEEKLSVNLSIETVGTTLVLAEQHNCEQLKEICIDFVASRENLLDVLLTDGFIHLMESCPLILRELLFKLDWDRKNL